MIGKWKKWVPALLVGLLLVVIALPTNRSGAGGTGNLTGTGTLSGGGSVTGTESEIEYRLETLLGKVPGVGEAHVMVTYKEDGGVEGILVVAEGGGNGVIVKHIMEVMQALFNVDSHKIKVIEGKS